MTALGNEDTFKPNGPIEAGSLIYQVRRAPSLRPSVTFLVAIIGGIGLGNFLFQGLRLSGSPNLPPLPKDTNATKVLSKVPGSRNPSVREARETQELARYYSLALLPCPWDTGKPRPASPHAAPRVKSQPAQALVSPAPAYPVLARRAGFRGVVDVTVLVDKTGLPATVSCGNGNLILQKAALDAATEWRFRPATQNGKPVPGSFNIHFEFKLATASWWAAPQFPGPPGGGNKWKASTEPARSSRRRAAA